MTEGNVIPHMTFVLPCVGREETMRAFLNQVASGILDEDAAATQLSQLLQGSLSPSTAKRALGSLFTYHYLKKGEKLGLTPLSTRYLQGELPYDDYILEGLTCNLEWAAFIPDLYDLAAEKKNLSKRALVDGLADQGYEIGKKETADRYLAEILPVLELTGVITYQDNIIAPGRRERKEVMKFAHSAQRALIRQLAQAERRDVSNKQMRATYSAAVKAHLHNRRNRTTVSKVQAEIDDILARPIELEETKRKGTGKSLWKLKDPLYDWQQSAVEKWLLDGQGIAKVVTGAGKTHMAMEIMARLKEKDQSLTVTIVVPTIVLLEQWYDNLVDNLRIDPDEIARKGGDHNEWTPGKKVLICVINSAIIDHYLMKVTGGLDSNLLIVDECHRAGAAQFRNIFEARRKWSLGLSATPEREADNAFNEVLVKNLGGIICTYTYESALNDGIIPRFEIFNYAVSLTEGERQEYEKLTKDIHNVLTRLRMRYPLLERPGIHLESMLRTLLSKHPQDKDIPLYFQKTRERKDKVVYRASGRSEIVRQVLEVVLGRGAAENTFAENSPLRGTTRKDKVIVFHEKIEEINDLYMALDSVEVSVYHSGFPPLLNRVGLDLYQNGQTKILLSVKALIEGVNVPKTNLGIIMASSASQTQRIQSLGRVLRRAEGKDKTTLVIVYVKGTTDERIYQKGIDWDHIIGSGKVGFRFWSEFGEAEIEAPKPRQEKQTPTAVENPEEAVDAEADEFATLSFDSKGKLFATVEKERRYLSWFDESALWHEFRKIKGGGGRLQVRPDGMALTRSKGTDPILVELGVFSELAEILVEMGLFKKMIPTSAEEKENEDQGDP